MGKSTLAHSTVCMFTSRPLAVRRQTKRWEQLATEVGHLHKAPVKEETEQGCDKEERRNCSVGESDNCARRTTLCAPQHRVPRAYGGSSTGQGAICTPHNMEPTVQIVQQVTKPAEEWRQAARDSLPHTPATCKSCSRPCQSAVGTRLRLRQMSGKGAQ